jgi:peptidyl-prolyl cis-trans isomerase SurA
MRARIALGLSVLAASAAFALVASSSRADVIERVVAVVNDDAIFLSELREKAAPYLPRALRAPTEAQRVAAIRSIYTQVLDHIIDQHLVAQAATEEEITVTDADVDTAIDNVREQSGLDTAEFWDAVAEQGFGNEADYRADIRAQLLHFRLLNARMGSRVNITEDDVRQRYDEVVAQARREARFDAAQILFATPPGASAPEINHARHLAESLRDSIHDESDFEAAMPSHGGRELRNLSQGSLDADLEDTLMHLEEGEVSAVVRGSRGFFVFLLRARHYASESVPTYESQRMTLYNEMRQEAMQHQETALMEELRREAAIDRRLDQSDE